jgi:hypothetical protein
MFRKLRVDLISNITLVQQGDSFKVKTLISNFSLKKAIISVFLFFIFYFTTFRLYSGLVQSGC